MELDDLKDIWKKSGPEFRTKNTAELALMLKGRSTSIVDKLKRSVWFELIFTFVAGLVLLVYALTLPPGALKWTSLSILVPFVAYTFYYFKKLSLLRRFNPGSENLKTHIDGLIASLNSLLKFYRRSYAILYPVYFVLALVFGAIERGTTDFFEALVKPAMILYLLLLAVIYYFLSTSFANWYVKKLYGNHLEKLKSLAHELEN
jgi:hypothetical protein